MKLPWYYRWHLKPYAKKVHVGSLAFYVILLISVIASTMSPQSHIRASSYTKTWTSTADFDTGSNQNIDTASNKAQLASTTNTYNENFSTTTYKDPATTANWNGKLNLPGDPLDGTVTGLQQKWKDTFGQSESVAAVAKDQINGYMYMVGYSGSFVAYKPADDTTIDLRSKILSLVTAASTDSIRGLAIDATNHYLYLVGTGGKFAVLSLCANPLDAVLTDLSAKASALNGTYSFPLAVDLDNHFLYVGGSNVFGYFDLRSDPSNTSFTNLSGKLSFFWSSSYTVYTLSIDQANHFLYVGASASTSVKLGAFPLSGTPSGGTLVDLSGKYAWSSMGAFSSTIDPVNNYLYLGCYSAEIVAFPLSSTPANNSVIGLTSKVSGNWGTSNIVLSLGYDPINHFVYLGGNNGRFGVFPATNNPGNAGFTYLTPKISAIFGTTSDSSVLNIEPSTGLVYLAGYAPRFGYFSGGGDPANGSFTAKSAVVASYIGFNLTARSTAYDSTNNIIYMGCNGGRLIAYNIGSGQFIDLASKITGWPTSSYINGLAYDATNHFIYLAGGDTTTNFGVLQATSNPATAAFTDLSGKLSSFWSYSAPSTMAIDSYNNFLYLSGSMTAAFPLTANPSGVSAINVSSRLSFTDYVYAMAYDSVNHYMYLGGTNYKFGALQSTATPASASFVTLTSKLTSTWSGSYIYSMAFDSVNGMIYVGGYNGKFGALPATNDPANAGYVHLSAKLPAGMSSSVINWLIDAGGIMYVLGPSNSFGAFNGGGTPASGSYTALDSKFADWYGLSMTCGLYLSSDSVFYLFGGKGMISSFQTGYASSKIAQSTKINAGTPQIAQATLTATSAIPTGTTLSFYLSNNGGSSWNLVNSGSPYTFASTSTDVRWKIALTTSNPANTPEVTLLTVSYSSFNSTTGQMNLTFNATEGTPVWYSLAGTTSAPTNTTLTLKARAAATSGGLSSATWSDIKTRADLPVNLMTLPVGGTPGLAQQPWIEIEFDFATTDGLNTPTVDDLTLSYVVNATPEIQNLTVSQRTDGSKVVDISYQSRDQDTGSNPSNSNQATVSFQYSADSGSTWHPCVTTTGAGLQSISQASFGAKSGTWNAGVDLANSYYNGTVMVKVLINDNELARNQVELASSAFSIDTKNPALGMISSNQGIQVNSGSSWTNNPAVTLTLSATDDTALSMWLSNDVEFSTGSYEPYVASKAWTLSSSDGNKTVYAKFKDALGNTTTANFPVLLDTTAPSAPLHLGVYDTSDRDLARYSLTLIWDEIPTIPDFQTYRIERSSNGGEYSTLVTTQNNSFADLSLDNNVTYSYRVLAIDTHTNASGASNVVSYRPTMEDITPPNIIGGTPKVEPGADSAKISWTTDEPSDAYVEFGTTTDYGNSQGSPTLNVSHSMTVTGLQPETTYHFRVRIRDNAGNLTVGSDATFKTTAPATAAKPVETLTLTDPEVFADPATGKVSINWSTGAPATSQIQYGITEMLGSESSEIKTLSYDHFVVLASLTPTTKYYYKVVSKDEVGKSQTSVIKYFTTPQSSGNAPAISSVAVSDVTLDSAIISWKTNTVTTSTIKLGKDDSYGQVVEDLSNGATTIHTVRLNGLEQGTVYHFRVSGTSNAGGSVASDDYVFSTLTMPTISNVQVKSANEKGTTITWSTNTECDSFVDFGVKGSTFDQSQGRAESVKDHSVTLIGLSSATSYAYKTKSRDKFGNLAESGEQSFTTIVDTTAPQIKDMKSETSIVTDANGESKAQAIISWSTDEPATSQVQYSLGMAQGDAYQYSTPEDANLSTSHVVVISNLLPAATYHMRIVSKDASTNIGVSDDYTVLTLKQETTLLQYIVQILEQRFFWMRGLGFDL